jgi:hypothetical protein
MSQANEDPVVRSSRRETVVVILVWLAAMTYTVGYNWLFAYGRGPGEMRLVLGIPDWVLWGIILPWSACVVVCWWFAYGFMSDESLGKEQQPPDDE